MSLLDAHAGLAGKVAVVVGGAGGFIGRGVTLALAKAGVAIATCDNDDEGLSTIGPEVEALGSRILSVRADVTDSEALDAFYDRVEGQFDRLDIVVNVPGGVKRSTLRRNDARRERARHPTQLRLCHRQCATRDSLDSARRSRRKHHQLHDHRGPPGRGNLCRLCGREGRDDELQSRAGRRARRRLASASISSRPIPRAPARPTARYTRRTSHDLRRSEKTRSTTPSRCTSLSRRHLRWRT